LLRITFGVRGLRMSWLTVGIDALRYGGLRLSAGRPRGLRTGGFVMGLTRRLEGAR
jgi:hypothetical protein